MNTRVLILLVCVAAHSSLAQGRFLPANPGALTRIGSIDGPLAGTNIYAQMLAGALPDSLTPVGMVDFHNNGLIFGPNAIVAGVPALSNAYVQMVAWDSILWGESLGNVPLDQLGRTDIVTVFLTQDTLPTFAPLFTRPAIVPIPEPSAWALFALGVASLWFARRRRK